MPPAMAAATHTTITAPAAVSLASFARGSACGMARSTVVSIAVFSNSMPITKPNRITQASHSVALSPQRKPNTVTSDMNNPKHSILSRILSVAVALGLLLSFSVTASAQTAEKVVNIGVTSSLGTLNPLLQDGGELNKYATGLQFLPLVELSSDLSFEGQLAESITTEDNLTFTVKLFENATWSDGEPITADDVIFTVLRLTSKTIGNITMGGYAALQGFDDNGNPPDGATSVDGIVKVDDHTLQFIFKAPTSLATVENSFGRYLMTLPKHKLESIPVEDLAKSEWFNHPDAVSGPYVVSEYDSNHYITYVANANYWKGAPKIGKLNIKIVEGSQLYAGLQSGEIDFVQPTMKGREYYTEFAKKLPADTVILTAGCAKYRYNKLNLGDIGGVPRVLDAGQCNDSYSLAVIALKLKEVFGLANINDLPIAYNIAWYEQKAVIVLLALLSLGVKNIHLGPTLPGFLSPNVAKVLVEKFGIAGIGDVDEDMKIFLHE